MKLSLLSTIFGLVHNVFGQEGGSSLCAEYDGATTFEYDIDYYNFNLTQRTTIQIDSCGSLYDTYLYFQEIDGTSIAECDDCGDCGFQTILDVVDVPAGQYRIGIGGFASYFGSYTVDVTCTPYVPIPKNCSNGPFSTKSFSREFTIPISTDDVGDTIVDTITVSGITETVQLVDLSVKATTTWVGDLLIKLKYNGEEIIVLSNEGISGDNVDVLITDTASEDCETKYDGNIGDDPRIYGECNPDTQLRSLIGDGSQVNGDWEVSIFDQCIDSSFCEPTNFVAWTLTFYTCPECESTTAYEYVGTAASVDDAEDLCEAIGSTLAIVKDSDDLEIYRQAWEDEGLPYCGVWNCDGQSAIALYDKDSEGTFTWSDGTAYDGSIPTFGVGEPNDLYGEDCVTMSFTSSTDGTLTYANDIGCEYEFSNQLYVFCNEDACNPYTPSPTECNGGYEYVGQANSVNDGRTLCENIGSTLATVNSDAGVAIYRQALEDEGIAQTGTWNGLGQTAIGLGDSANEGQYVWDDGTECKLNNGYCYDYWGSGEPNDLNGEDCVTFSFPSDSTTYSNDINCDYSFPNKLYVFCNIECDDVCDQYIYVDTPMSFEDAQAYCKSEYGTSLAGVNEDDIPQANCAITDPGEPTWVGLYSETDPAFFEFVSGEECDVPFSGACVDFWGTFNKGKRAPQCLKEGGYQCGYYRESSELVYNNLDCETEAPFLCEKYPVSSTAHIGLFNEIKDYIDEGINGKNGGNENNFYMTIITTIAGVILIITLIVELIYCLCKSKNTNEKVPYDKLGSEI